MSTNRRKVYRGWFIAPIALAVIVLLGSGLVTFFLLTHQSKALVTANQVVGHAFFVSSGQLNEGNSQGNNDQLEIEIQNVPNPAPGMNYYAWLLSDEGKRPATAILLGTVSVSQGNVHFHYPGDQLHTNLIGITSQLLITEESARSLPKYPSSDRHMWRYYAELPQRPLVGDRHGPTALDSIRALLNEDPELHGQGIQGGLNIQFLKNTGKVLEWVFSARDSWDSRDTAFVHRQIVRTLDYLDGKDTVQSDVTSGATMLVNPLLVQVPLLTTVPNQVPDSYPHLIDGRLTSLLAAPGITPEMRGLAVQSRQALVENVQPLLMRVRLDAKQLVNMNDAQLLQPSALSLLDEMVALANYAFVGRLDPSTNEVQPGVVQLFYNIQRLATYDIAVYKSSGS
jgi:eukaryotic-like serine/threonine-protein kinase